MKNVLILLFVMTCTISNAQLERIGIYGGPSVSLLDYSKNSKNRYTDNIVVFQSFRIGGMASFYGNRRFSYESGILMDYLKRENEPTNSFSNDQGEKISLSNHKLTNIGIPISLMMRTNTTRSCVTYFKFSLINFFTIQESQCTKNVSVTENLPTAPDFINNNSMEFDYFSTDIEFGFGTFWYLRRFGARLCFEPKITLLQFRNSNYSNQNPDIKIMDAGVRAISRLAFEVTLYKDLF